MCESRHAKWVLLIAVCLAASQALALDDPTRPAGLRAAHVPAATTPQRPAWRLQSILVSPHRRVAVINGHSVAPGERVGGARVTRIGVDRVYLRTAAGRVIQLQLLPSRGIRKKRKQP